MVLVTLYDLYDNPRVHYTLSAHAFSREQLENADFRANTDSTLEINT